MLSHGKKDNRTMHALARNEIKTKVSKYGKLHWVIAGKTFLKFYAVKKEDKTMTFWSEERSGVSEFCNKVRGNVRVPFDLARQCFRSPGIEIWTKSGGFDIWKPEKVQSPVI